MLQGLGLPDAAAISPVSLLISLAIGAVLSQLLRLHFVRFGSTLANREEFAQVFPFVLLTTVLIITVVKSSLALSLGLVGALSIVRFRTPIKEPEELAYLFMAIAIGLGLGAAQIVPTILGTLAILGVMTALKWTRRTTDRKNLYLSIEAEHGAGGDEELSLERLNETIARHVASSDLRRVDVRNGSLAATYFLDVSTANDFSKLTEDLRRSFPAIGVTFLDQNRLPSI